MGPHWAMGSPVGYGANDGLWGPQWAMGPWMGYGAVDGPRSPPAYGAPQPPGVAAVVVMGDGSDSALFDVVRDAQRRVCGGRQRPPHQQQRPLPADRRRLQRPVETHSADPYRAPYGPISLYGPVWSYILIWPRMAPYPYMAPYGPISLYGPVWT